MIVSNLNKTHEFELSIIFNFICMIALGIMTRKVSTVLAFFFDFSDYFLYFYRTVFFDFTEAPSPQRWHGEPSLLQRRRLAKSMTNLRATSLIKFSVQSIHTSTSDNPLKRFIKSTHVLHHKHTFVHMSQFSKYFLCPHFLVTRRHNHHQLNTYRSWIFFRRFSDPKLT